MGEGSALGVLFTLCVIFVVSMILLLIYMRHSKNADQDPCEVVSEEDSIEEEEEPIEEAEVITVRAEVVDMYCRAEMVGIKQPKIIKEFVIFFKIDNDQVESFYVQEEYYNDYEIGMSGTLTIIDGVLNCFEPDEK